MADIGGGGDGVPCNGNVGSGLSGGEEAVAGLATLERGSRGLKPAA